MARIAAVITVYSTIRPNTFTFLEPENKHDNADAYFRQVQCSSRSTKDYSSMADGLMD